MNIFTIKIIALILMLIDHIGEFFPDSPIWFRWLGRLAAPLFFYALAVGFQHTRNRKKYLLRLYLANVGMVFFNQIMCMLQRKPDYVAYQPKNQNIFTTLFCAGVLICIWENRKEKKKFFTYIGTVSYTHLLVEDLAFMKAFNPHMVGIGPFIPQKDTPFGEMEPGSLEMTLFLLAIIRLMLPKVLLPATTALGTIHSRGRELGILAGGNVVMPNLSPVKVRKKYALYRCV